MKIPEELYQEFMGDITAEIDRENKIITDLLSLVKMDTKVSTIDNKTIVIPNGMLTNNSITNATAKDERQLDLRVGISYNADIKKAKSMIEKLLSEDASILKEEQMNVFVNDLADSAVVLGIRAWVKNEEYWATRWRLLEEIKVELDENGIEIPYPQVTVHMKEDK